MNFDLRCIHITFNEMSRISQILECILHLNASSNDIIYVGMHPCKFTVHFASFMCCFPDNKYGLESRVRRLLSIRCIPVKKYGKESRVQTVRLNYIMANLFLL
jgi:hypothetical protein